MNLKELAEEKIGEIANKILERDFNANAQSEAYGDTYATVGYDYNDKDVEASFNEAIEIFQEVIQNHKKGKNG